MEVVTPAQVEYRLRQLGAEMDKAHEELVASEVRYSDAKSSFEIRSAHARMAVKQRSLEKGVKVTVQEIEDQALIQCAAEYTELNMADALVRAARENVRKIRTHIDIARSVGTSVRASMDVS